jgi:voltage-gated potassium channel
MLGAGHLARLVVTGQMIADLIILGVAIKVVVDAVRRGQQGKTRPMTRHQRQASRADRPR